ncbi:MAG: metallophosphoesterase, partial [Chloroflexota bacterium]
MRIAILADIHGNSIALNAVLADIQARGGVDSYWILGDLCAIGFDPSGVLDRLGLLQNALYVRGNADRYVATGDLPEPTFNQVAADSNLIPLLAEVVGHFNWVKGNITGRGWLG